jgi:hypothetical protein
MAKISVTSILVLLCVQLPSSADNSTELREAVLNTLKWSDKIGTHQLSLRAVFRENHTNDVIERIHLTDELYDHESRKLQLIKCSGVTAMNIVSGTSTDQSYSEICGGSMGEVRCRATGFAETGINCGANGDCLAATRGFDLFNQPLLFAIPVSNGAQITFADMLEYLMTCNPDDVSKDNRSKDVTKYRVFRKLRHKKTNRDVLLGYELCTSKRKSDRGRIVSLRQVSLIPESTTFDSDKQIEFVERTAESIWTEVKSGEEFICLLKKVTRTFYTMSNGKRTPELFDTFDYQWSFDRPEQSKFNEDYQVSTLSGFRKQVDRHLSR